MDKYPTRVSGMSANSGCIVTSMSVISFPPYLSTQRLGILATGGPYKREEEIATSRDFDEFPSSESFYPSLLVLEVYYQQ